MILLRALRDCYRMEPILFTLMLATAVIVYVVLLLVIVALAVN